MSKKRWDLALFQVQREEEQHSELAHSQLSEEQYSELAFSHLPEDLVDPFAASPMTDFGHNCEFSTSYLEVLGEQYMEIFESARKR